jgi:hypothetical protein
MVWSAVIRALRRAESLGRIKAGRSASAAWAPGMADPDPLRLSQSTLEDIASDVSAEIERSLELLESGSPLRGRKPTLLRLIAGGADEDGDRATDEAPAGDGPGQVVLAGDIGGEDRRTGRRDRDGAEGDGPTGTARGEVGADPGSPVCEAGPEVPAGPSRDSGETGGSQR